MELVGFVKEKLRMRVSYMKLQKLMLENQMKRNDLMRAAEISGTTATKINGYAFYNYDNLTSVVIGDSVTSIGYNAFAYCSNLMSVVIGDSVTSIGNDAFGYCYSLTTIYCEAVSQPSGWDSGWNYYCSANVVWGYKGE